MFATETMAELCFKQGLKAKALDIYRQLAAQAPDDTTRERRLRRVAEIERELGPASPPALAADAELPEPGVRATCSGEEVLIDWRLPADLTAPAVQVLILRRTNAGIEAEQRTIRVEDPRGRLALKTPALHSARAAAGRMEGERFVPLARSR